ncbi:MAG: hypothetical protein ABUT39_28060 [Acidobacteriota bacterium]
MREGYRVIEEQIRRGRRTAQALDEEPWNASAHRERRRPSRHDEEDRRREGRGSFSFLAAQMRRTERLAREILRQIGSARPDPWRLAELVCRLYVESVADLAVLGLDAMGALIPRRGDRRFEDDVERIDRDIRDNLEEIEAEEDFEEIDEDLAEEIEEDFLDDSWDWPAAPSVPTVVRSTVPIPVSVWSHERTEIDLDLPAGSQSLDLDIEPPLAAGTGEPPHPAFEAELVAIAGGPTILRITVPRDLPAGRYLRRVLIGATGEPVGTLTVQVGAVPPPKPSPGKHPKARKKT